MCIDELYSLSFLLSHSRLYLMLVTLKTEEKENQFDAPSTWSPLRRSLIQPEQISIRFTHIFTRKTCWMTVSFSSLAPHALLHPTLTGCLLFSQVSSMFSVINLHLYFSGWCECSPVCSTCLLHHLSPPPPLSSTCLLLFLHPDSVSVSAVQMPSLSILAGAPPQKKRHQQN